MPEHAELDRAYDAILQKARNELERLRAEIREQEALISGLTKMRYRAGALDVVRHSVEAKTNGHAPTWPERTDGVLSAHRGEKLSPRQIAEALGAKNGRFEGMNMKADVLVRSTLKRCAERYGWQHRKKGHNIFWWKD